jgi:hypothetical protein
VTRTLALLCLSACTSGVDPTGECDGTERTDVAIGRLAIGTDETGAFVPVENGARMELVLGAQGGWMLLPVIEATTGKTADAAMCVELAAEIDGHSEPVAHRVRARFRSRDGALYGGPFQFFLSFDLAALEGRSALLSARIAGSTEAVEHEVLLANDR